MFVRLIPIAYIRLIPIAYRGLLSAYIVTPWLLSSSGQGIAPRLLSLLCLCLFWVSLEAQMVKNQPQCGRPGSDPWVGKIPCRRAWQPAPVVLPGESPQTEKPGGLQPMGSQRVGHDWVTKHSTLLIGSPMRSGLPIIISLLVTWELTNLEL